MKSQTHQFWIIFGIVVFGLVFLLVTGSRNPQNQPQAQTPSSCTNDSDCPSQDEQNYYCGYGPGPVYTGKPKICIPEGFAYRGSTAVTQSNSNVTLTNSVYTTPDYYNQMMRESTGNTTVGNTFFQTSPNTQTTVTQQPSAFVSQGNIWSPCQTRYILDPMTNTRTPQCVSNDPVYVQREVSSPNSSSGSRIETCSATCQFSSGDTGGVSVGWPEICQPVIDVNPVCTSLTINNFAGNSGGFTNVSQQNNSGISTFGNQAPSNWLINVNDDITPSSNDSIYSFLNQAETLMTGGVTIDSLLSGITSRIISGLQPMAPLFPSQTR